MNAKKTAYLVPFQPDALISKDLKISIQIERQQQLLTLYYLVKGDLSSIVLPPQVPYPIRKDALWKHTCLEAFLSWEQEPFYWEFNFSPSGDWNCYYFDDYRNNQTTEMRMRTLVRETPHLTNAMYSEKVTIDLSLILPKIMPQKFTLAISAVIEGIDQTMHYWALTHKVQKPDFHLRESFILTI